MLRFLLLVFSFTLILTTYCGAQEYVVKTHIYGNKKKNGLLKISIDDVNELGDFIGTEYYPIDAGNLKGFFYSISDGYFTMEDLTGVDFSGGEISNNGNITSRYFYYQFEPPSTLNVNESLSSFRYLRLHPDGKTISYLDAEYSNGFDNLTQKLIEYNSGIASTAYTFADVKLRYALHVATDGVTTIFVGDREFDFEFISDSGELLNSNIPRPKLFFNRNFSTVHHFSPNGSFLVRLKGKYFIYSKDADGSASFSARKLPIRSPKGFFKSEIKGINDNGDYFGNFVKSKRGYKFRFKRKAMVGFARKRPKFLERLVKPPEGCRFNSVEAISNSGIITAKGFCKVDGEKMIASFTLIPSV